MLMLMPGIDGRKVVLFEKIENWITLKAALLFSAVFGALYCFINFSGFGVAGLLEITGGPNILDFQAGYSPAEAYDMLAALGAGGRAFYLGRILPVDFPFPLSYMLCFAGWIAWLLKHLEFRNRLKYLLIVPVLAMLFDWAENIGIIVMLDNYPLLPLWAVSVASVSGILKAAFTVCSIAAIVVLIIARLASRFSKKNKKGKEHEKGII